MQTYTHTKVLDMHYYLSAVVEEALHLPQTGIPDMIWCGGDLCGSAVGFVSIFIQIMQAVCPRHNQLYQFWPNNNTKPDKTVTHPTYECSLVCCKDR